MKRTLLAIILGTQSLMGQHVDIAGEVIGEDQKPIPGVTVQLLNTSYGTYTGPTGSFMLKNVQQGDYTLSVSGIGYGTIEQPLQVSSQEKLQFDFKLKERVMDLPQVVVEDVTLTGGESNLDQIPGSAHYISPRTIDKFNYSDIHRTLQTIPGIHIQEEDGFGLRPNIGLRASGVERSSKITIMEDGVLSAPAPYAAPAAYYFPTAGRMQAMEVLKGNSQIKYGPFTTGGAINLISTQIPENFAYRLHLNGGSYGGRNVHSYVGQSRKYFGYLAEVFRYQSDGFKQMGDANTGFEKTDYLIKFRLNTAPEKDLYHSLTFKLGNMDEISNETYLGLAAQDFEQDPYQRYSASQYDQMNAEQSQYSVTHLFRYKKHLTLTTVAYRNEFARNWYKLDRVKDSSGSKVKIGAILDNPTTNENVYNILNGASTNNGEELFLKANNRVYFAQGIQTVLGWRMEKSEVKHDVKLGLRLHQDEMDRFQWYDTYTMENSIMKQLTGGDPGSESNRIERAQSLASFLQYRLKYKRFIVTSGLRYESIDLSRDDYGTEDPNRTGENLATRSNNVDVWIPGIGINYKSNPHLDLFAGVHKGFAPPGTTEGTQPEISDNYELGANFNKSGATVKTAVFYNSYRNLLGSDMNFTGGSGTGDLFNGGSARSYGLELSSSYMLFRNKGFAVPVSLVYTYTDAVFMSSFDSDFSPWSTVEKGDHLPYLANHQVTGTLGFFKDKISGNVNCRFVDFMRTTPGQGGPSNDEIIESRLVVDVSASYQLLNSLRLFARVNNITNQVYVVSHRPAGLRPGLPRTINFGIKVDVD